MADNLSSLTQRYLQLLAAEQHPPTPQERYTKLRGTEDTRFGGAAMHDPMLSLLGNASQFTPIGSALWTAQRMHADPSQAQQSLQGFFDPAAAAAPWAGKTRVAPEKLHELINSRDTVYHATRPGSLTQILTDGKIVPGGGNGFHGVAVSRVPTIEPKGGSMGPAVSMVLDRAALPKHQPTVDSGWEKTKGRSDAPKLWWDMAEPHEVEQYNQYNYAKEQGFISADEATQAQYTLVKDIESRFKNAMDVKMNPNFEYELRTKGKPVPVGVTRGAASHRAVSTIQKTHPDTIQGQKLIAEGQAAAIDAIDYMMELGWTPELQAKQNVAQHKIQQGQDMMFFAVEASRRLASAMAPPPRSALKKIILNPNRVGDFLGQNGIKGNGTIQDVLTQYKQYIEPMAPGVPVEFAKGKEMQLDRLAKDKLMEIFGSLRKP